MGNSASNFHVRDVCQISQLYRRSLDRLLKQNLNCSLCVLSYQFTFKKQETCKKVCTRSYDPENSADRSKLAFLKKGMQLNYQHHW